MNHGRPHPKYYYGMHDGYPWGSQVNGVGATVADVLSQAGDQALSDSTLLFLQSPQFAPFLDAVKQKAREGVIEESQKNAYTLLALAAGAGAVGGFIFNGSRGLLVGAAVAGLAVRQLLKGPPA